MYGQRIRLGKTEQQLCLLYLDELMQYIRSLASYNIGVRNNL